MVTIRKSKDIRLDFSKHPINIRHIPFVLTFITGLLNQIHHTQHAQVLSFVERAALAKPMKEDIQYHRCQGDWLADV